MPAGLTVTSEMALEMVLNVLAEIHGMTREEVVEAMLDGRIRPGPSRARPSARRAT